eukprot:TRINITY_DN26001_c1_g1_i12.p4 TRINITY_DN26001_c1_g1~~TRINITY_DN26001_c1_g1_i12.p4  ORF type:complete len:113 (-),score=4.38 TRINITY_DN26001_c1_g1_i12:325-663(-)
MFVVQKRLILQRQKQKMPFLLIQGKKSFTPGTKLTQVLCREQAFLILLDMAHFGLKKIKFSEHSFFSFGQGTKKFVNFFKFRTISSQFCLLKAEKIGDKQVWQIEGTLRIWV